MNKPELHLIVLWNRARYKEKEIINDINKELKILECIEIEWSKNKVVENFTRFYGVKLPNRHGKPNECGFGKFLLCTVLDEKPNYEYVETSRGFDYVNTNIFNLKQKYRAMTGGGGKIHATNSPEETNHDITLFLGKNYQDYLKDAPEKWNGEYRQLKRDLSGAHGWSTFQELFYTLNATVNYVVLRGIDNLNHFKTNEDHGDIDIFTNDYKNTAFIINGKPEKNKFRPHYLTKVGNELVYLDVWNSECNYYDKKWSSDIIQNREFYNGFYILDKKNSFYELIYHCLMHKQKIAKDYYAKARELFDVLGLNKKYNIEEYKYPFDLYYLLLTKFMVKNNYSYIHPKDYTIKYNQVLTTFDEIIFWLQNKYEITDIKPYMINIKNDGSGYVYFTGFFNGNKLFIKWGGILDSAINEYKMSKKLYDVDNKHFIKPYLYHFDAGKNFIAFEFTEGVGLDYLIGQNLLTKELKTYIITQIEEIAQSLYTTNIVHRDVRPDNLILVNNSELKLMDLQFAINFKTYKNDFVLRKNPKLINCIGGRFAKGHYDWDDMYSFKMILNELDARNENIEKLIGKKRVSRFFYKTMFWAILISKFILRKIKRMIIQ